MFVAPPAVPDSQQKTTKGLTAEDVLSNPGTYEEIGRKLKGDYNNNISLCSIHSTIVSVLGIVS